MSDEAPTNVPNVLVVQGLNAENVDAIGISAAAVEITESDTVSILEQVIKDKDAEIAELKREVAKLNRQNSLHAVFQKKAVEFCQRVSSEEIAGMVTLGVDFTAGSGSVYKAEGKIEYTACVGYGSTTKGRHVDEVIEEAIRRVRRDTKEEAKAITHNPEYSTTNDEEIPF